MSEPLVIPANSRSLTEFDTTPRHLLLCGIPGSGKTFQSLTTSPNPLYCAIAQGIQDPRLKKLGVPMYPFYDIDYCTNIIKKTQIPNAVIDWIELHGPKLTVEQTLILDDLTTLQDYLHELSWKQTLIEKKQNEEPDGFLYWDKIRDYWIRFFKLLDRLTCNVIVCAHLREVLGKQGNLISYAPILEGGYKMRIGQKFSDVAMIIATNKKVGEELTTSYQWQIKPSDLFPFAKSRSEINKILIPASFAELLKV